MAISPHDRDIHELVHIMANVNKAILAQNNLLAKIVCSLDAMAPSNDDSEEPTDENQDTDSSL